MTYSVNNIENGKVFLVGDDETELTADIFEFDGEVKVNDIFVTNENGKLIRDNEERDRRSANAKSRIASLFARKKKQ